ncbi:MAG: hypothetical protein WA001_05520, partial [Patescibacteria group bacterium]
DPNPFAGDRSSTIITGVTGAGFDNSVDWIHTISAYNATGTVRGVDPDNYSAAMNIEYSYDQGARSGGEAIEWLYWFKPATYKITFSGTSGTAAAGENLTFTGGEICRPTQSYAMSSTVARFTCVDNSGVANPPEVSDVVTGGCAACAGTVATIANDVEYIPFSVVTNTLGFGGFTDFVNMMWKDSGGQYVAYQTRFGDRRVNLGWESFNTPSSSYANKVSVPAYTLLGSAVPTDAGDFAIDTSFATTRGGQLVYHDGTALRALVPTKTFSTPTTTTGTTFVDLVLDQSFYNFATITAVGCRDKSDATGGGTLTIETLTGAAIDVTAGTVPCVGSDDAITWRTTTDADAVLGSGAGVRADATGLTALRNYTVFLAVMNTPQ